MECWQKLPESSPHSCCGLGSGWGPQCLSQWVPEAGAAFVCHRRPARRLRLQPAPAQAWEMVFFSLCVAAGTVYNRKKKKERERERERENDQASRLENKET